MKKKEELVAARLPEDLVNALRKIEEVEQVDRSTTVRKLLSRAVAEWRRDYAAQLYAERKVTLERAASEAGISVREMMEYLRAKKVPGQYELSDLEEDMARFYRKAAGTPQR
jgi:predicted HTH domain antitoxin